jgi:hypothetical protein
VTGVLAIPAVMKARFRDLGQSQRIVKFSKCEQSGIAGDRRTVELKAQLAVESYSQTLISAFTHWTLRFSGTLKSVIPIQKSNYSMQIPVELKIVWEMWVEIEAFGASSARKIGKNNARRA